LLEKQLNTTYIVVMKRTDSTEFQGQVFQNITAFFYHVKFHPATNACKKNANANDVEHSHLVIDRTRQQRQLTGN